MQPKGWTTNGVIHSPTWFFAQNENCCQDRGAWLTGILQELSETLLLCAPRAAILREHLNAFCLCRRHPSTRRWLSHVEHGQVDRMADPKER
jgi:hypothetical protein